MNTMTISPIQPMRHDYVTKGEFAEFTEDISDKFAEQKFYMDDGFDKLGEQIDAVEGNMTKRFDEQESYMKDGFKKVFKQI